MGDITFIQGDGSTNHLARMTQKSHHGHGSHAFAAAALSYNTNDLSGRNLNADAVHRRNLPFCGKEVGFQITDIQYD